MKGEIGVTRRATYKAEDAIKKKERVKKKQDLVIDKLNEEIRRLNESKAIYEAQIIAQKGETEAAEKTLQDAAKEISAVDFEKKQLGLQWRSSLIGIQKRDEAVQTVTEAIAAVEQRELEIVNEIRGLQGVIREEQEKNEKLSGVEGRNNREMQYLQQQMTVVRGERERLAGQYSMLRRSLDKADEESQQFDNAITSCNNELEILEKYVQRVSRQITEVYNKIEAFVSDQTTSKRNEVSTLKSVKKVSVEVQRKEEEVIKIKNEIARVKVDTLNIKSNQTSLYTVLDELAKDLENRGKLIQQYEGEIKGRHHQIEKKQLYVDRLNREFDEKRRKLEEELGEAVESAGPLEIKIKSLRKLIAERVTACGGLQKEWLKKQHAIMEEQTSAEKIKTAMSEIRDKKAVLDGRKVRVERDLEVVFKDRKQLETGVRQVKMEMDIMNGHLGRYERESVTLKSEMEVMEKQFIARLKAIEKAATEMESHIAEIEAAKTAIGRFCGLEIAFFCFNFPNPP